MTTAIQPIAGLDDATMLALVSGGDTSRLSPAQKTAYYLARCETAGLDPRAQPFAFMKLQGKETLYATKACSDQLAAKHGLRVTITDQRTEDGIRIVTAHVEAKDGRVTEEIGALSIKGLQGEALANALMKVVTKAKRRAVLSVCGLGALDETEVESIPGALHVAPPPLEDGTSRKAAAIVAEVERIQAPPQIAEAVEVLGGTVVEHVERGGSPKAIGEVLKGAVPAESSGVLLAIACAPTRADLNRLGKEIRSLPEEHQAEARAAFNKRAEELKS